ncbi:30S ribosomal protein S16 [Patescibacteria group bacterium]|nr:30S ribosomal protein S16 [Patescibacteria group bacterium]MCL5409949.1 30S ribosomal protein S16 [Patescibacteria group bacterium]
MSVKIRLMRIGNKKRPFYRVVAVDERKKRGGEYIEALGTYNPLTKPKEINIHQDRLDAWKKQGAIFSDGFLRIIGQAPQRPPRKPKKVKNTPAEKVATEPEPSVNTESSANEETVVTQQNPAEGTAASSTAAESANQTSDEGHEASPDTSSEVKQSDEVKEKDK